MSEKEKNPAFQLTLEKAGAHGNVTGDNLSSIKPKCQIKRTT